MPHRVTAGNKGDVWRIEGPQACPKGLRDPQCRRGKRGILIHVEPEFARRLKHLVSEATEFAIERTVERMELYPRRRWMTGSATPASSNPTLSSVRRCISRSGLRPRPGDAQADNGHLSQRSPCDARIESTWRHSFIIDVVHILPRLHRPQQHFPATFSNPKGVVGACADRVSVLEQSGVRLRETDGRRSPVP